jgi:hypothetical protein
MVADAFSSLRSWQFVVKEIPRKFDGATSRAKKVRPDPLAGRATGVYKISFATRRFT